MKKIHFLAVVAFAFLLSMNAGVFLESNNWDSQTEVAHAQIVVKKIAPRPVANNWHKRIGLPCWVNGGPGLLITCPWTPLFHCIPAPCS